MGAGTAGGAPIQIGEVLPLVHADLEIGAPVRENGGRRFESFLRGPTHSPVVVPALCLAPAPVHHIFSDHNPVPHRTTRTTADRRATPRVSLPQTLRDTSPQPWTHFPSATPHPRRTRAGTGVALVKGMSDNAKNKDTAPMLALFLTALTAPASEAPASPAQLAARFATAKFTLRAEPQAPRPFVAPNPFSATPALAAPIQSASLNPATTTTAMNPPRKKSFPVHFISTPIFTLPIDASELRQNGVTPLLIKSIRAQMAAAHGHCPALARSLTFSSANN